MKRIAHSMSRVLLPTVLVVLVPALAWACIWDSDTLQDELQGRSSAFHIVTGQVPQHGRLYYERRLTRSLELFQRASQSIEVLYDLAGAYMRLSEYDKAIEMLEKADAIAPDRYKTHSNLGVAYFLKAEASKREGDYESALAHTKRALTKHRDAHFGAGWLFEKVIAFKLAGSPSERTFLGTDYGMWKASLRNLARERAKRDGVELDKDVDHVKPLLTLLRSHPDFADGYLVLGLNFHGEWNLNLALWSYVRALELGHPRKDVIQKHIDEIFDHWKEVFKLRQQKQGQRLVPKEESLAVIRATLQHGTLWLAEFQKAEAALIAGSNDLPDFTAVLKALEAKGVKRRDGALAGLVGGRAGASAGAPTRDAHDEQQVRPGVNGPANARPRAKAPREGKSQQRESQQLQGPALDSEAPVGGSAAQAPSPQARVSKARLSKDPGPAQGSPDRGARTRSSPPVMSGREAPADVSYLAADGPETAGPPALEGAGASAPEGEPVPWYVIFGFVMLAVCIGAVALGRRRSA